MALARDRVMGPLGGLGGVEEALSVGRAVSSWLITMDRTKSRGESAQPLQSVKLLK